MHIYKYNIFLLYIDFFEFFTILILITFLLSFMKKIPQLLKDFGMSEKESQVYIALLEMGEANIAQIAKQSGVKRSTVYLALNSLKETGLVSSLKKSKTIFCAEDPRKMLDELDRKKELLETTMPELLASFALFDRKPGVKYFEGISGIKEIYYDFLKYKNSEVLALNSNDYRDFFEEDFLIDYFIPERKKRRIWIRVIYPETEFLKEWAAKDVEHFKKSRFISSKKFKIEMGIYLYGNNKVALISYRDKFGTILTSQAMFNTLKSMFEVMWEDLAK